VNAAHHKKSGLGLGLLVLSMLYWMPAQAQQYTITDMGAFVGAAINNSGQVAGSGYNGNSAVLWSGGTLTNLGAGSAYAINTPGQVVGSSAQGTATLWANGTSTSIRQYFSSASGINDSGMVVGFITNSSAPFGVQNSVATVWSGGSASTLTTPLTNNSGASAISQGGVVVGSLSPIQQASGQSNQAVEWRGGQLISLACSPATPCNSAAVAINASGQVVGSNVPAGYGPQALLWGTNGAVTVLGAGSASGINDSGEIVGAGESVGGGSTFASLWFNGSMKDLNSLISPSDPLPANVLLFNAVAINNNGWIVAEGTNDDAYLLTPSSVVATPLPASAWLLVSGLGGLAAVRRRRRAA
jgi:probable HAF family extracellular repeat protein